VVQCVLTWRVSTMLRLRFATYALFSFALLTVAGEAAANPNGSARSASPGCACGGSAPSLGPATSLSSTSSSRATLPSSSPGESLRSTTAAAPISSPATRETRSSAEQEGRLYAPKQQGESDQAFFQRAAREIGSRTGPGGQLTPESRAALARLAQGAGYNAIRSVVTGGGVVGSASGNSYVTYYKEGFTQANIVGTRAPAAPSTGASSKPADAPGRSDPALEKSVRDLLSQSPTGRQALARLDAAGVSIRFREGGGTMNHAASRSVVLDTKMGNGADKPVAWLAVSTAHESSHAWDDKRKQTPSTVSPIGARYSEAKSQMAVTPELRKEVLAERRNYVTRQVAGEARSMTTEVRVRRELEAKGVDFHRLDDKLGSTYGKAHDAVYKAAGVKPPDPAAH